MRLAVVAVGYNRPKSLKRLLDSLASATYGEDKVDLVISLDHSGEDESKQVADQFCWSHGEKKCRVFSVRQGLRDHILQCGDLTEEYDAVAVFEDDIVVAPGFYQYMKETVNFYGGDPSIAGISLYSRQWNQVTDRIFEPEKRDSDVYFMQLAKSWGQVWTRSQWKGFRRWYAEHQGMSPVDKSVPSCVVNWSEKSWLKYYIWYCVDQNKYFVYPYTSLTTNFMEAGEHSVVSSWRYQVALQSGVVTNYRLCPLTKSAVRYDVFYENQNTADWLDLPEKDVCVDLYGGKETVKGYRYWLTSRSVELPVIRSFGLEMHPMEQNIQYRIEGDFFKLYQLPEDYEMPSPKPRQKKIEWVEYDIRGEGIHFKNLFMWCKGCLMKLMYEIQERVIH